MKMVGNGLADLLYHVCVCQISFGIFYSTMIHVSIVTRLRHVPCMLVIDMTILHALFDHKTYLIVMMVVLIDG